MVLRSLRLRLLVSAAAAIFLALALAGFGLGMLFERHIERREALSMEAKARELLGTLRLDANGKPFVDTQPSDSRFNAPAGGLYWQVTTAAGQEHSPSLWDQSLPAATETPRDQWRVRRIPGPFEQGLLVIERMVRPDESGRAVLVQVATDDSALIHAQREFSREMIGSLVLLWLVLIGAAYGQVVLGLKPLARIRMELDRMRRNPGARLSADHPAEIDPLANAINSLADARAADVDRARRRAADLAHSLKTPLAALAAQSRRAREAGAHEAADGLDRAIAAAGAALEAELARSRSAVAREAQASSRANVCNAAEAVAAVIERTEAGERIVFEIDVPEDIELPFAASDLAEILGALMENAARFARRRVIVSGVVADDEVCVTVSDDGPGIADTRAATALVRGGRLDEAGPGHGFGLAIVSDLVSATDGAMTLGTGPLGGLEVRLAWPAAAAS
ncbi:sensor histidine kinase [uncultured Sphingosinicella sp.]|uniref:sensor histidine kinase n=1 Tax=uncultured Sphingosinicella sp. TaxID=478748 RepID=UPI0030DCE1E8|tara:strand:+ start:92983 stop:94338 length:1356 start_codon:yes stop_codon:yes gene_type:complete